MSALRFTRIEEDYSAGDYEACAEGISFSIVRCIRPVRFALTARRDGNDLTGDIGLQWGTLRAAKERAQNILDKAEGRSWPT